jgi:hypothetical protein
MSNWPTRSEWARARQASPGRLPDPPTALSEYATPAEIAALKLALRNRLTQLGTKTAHPFPFQRKCVARALELIDAGELPLQTRATEGAKDILAPFYARYCAARAATLKKLALPATDDDAWAQELQRRATAGKGVGRISHWNTKRK